MTMKLEICVDNHESLVTAVQAGADRIELCASLREGGLTPPWSFIEATLHVGVPVFVMIRPRSCDFLYTSQEIEMMHRDIHMARQLGVPGVVFGVLTADGEIDAAAMKSLVAEAGDMEVTCHRAVDQVRDVHAAIDTLAGLGVKRILTSGQQETLHAGMDVLAGMVRYARRRLMIMAAGVTPQDVREIVVKTGVDEVHSAAARYRRSTMGYFRGDAKMGQGDDFSLNVVDGEIVRGIKTNLSGL
jgi:copper homeostasis protein